MNIENFNNFHCLLFEFMAGLHDCHECKYLSHQINGRGKQRTYCKKYSQPIQRVRNHCFDRYHGFSGHELRMINKQYFRGECSFIINGLQIMYEKE